MQEPWPRPVRSRELGAVVESACVVKVHVGLKSVGYHVLIVLSALDGDDFYLEDSREEAATWNPLFLLTLSIVVADLSVP
jgi:hypothetical protein